MKVWIGSRGPNFVDVFPHKPDPEWWDTDGRYWVEPEEIPEHRQSTGVCRRIMARLLRGRGKGLPKIDTKELIKVEIFAK